MNIKELKNKFIEIYKGSDEDIRVFSSPGRVNLIGEHTDYSGGFVFPAALTMNTTVIVRPRADNIINLVATDLDCKVSAPLDQLQLDKYKNLKWGNYQLGVADELQKAAYKLVGCDMLFHGTIPFGAGLSSSASIEVATALALVTLSNEINDIRENIDMIEMAVIGQKAENNYVGVNCGIMDQFASAMGKKDHAIFLDTKDLSYKLVPLNIKGYKILISNTNKKRSLITSKYNERRTECEKGLNILQEVMPNICCLGEISYKQFKEHEHIIKDDTIRKRIEHVISENDRVKRSVNALSANDLKMFGKLMIESHDSLRDLYEVTGTELDTLVDEALKIDGVIGSRMTGAGFGGCTVSIVKGDAVEQFIKQVGKNYFEDTGLEADFYISEIGDGGKEIK